MATYYTSGYTPPAGITNAGQVKSIQKQLQNSGFNVGATGADGIWGKNTQRAYENYLKAGNNGVEAGSYTSYTPAANYDPYAAQKAQINAQFDMQKANLDAQAAQLADDYDRARGQAYVNARLGAIGNNERVASLGLAGNLYSGPQSGFSETSRIAENIAMRNAINDAALQEQAQLDEINREIAAAKLERDMQLAAFLESGYNGAIGGGGSIRSGSTVASLGSGSGSGSKRYSADDEEGNGLALLSDAVAAIEKEKRERGKQSAQGLMSYYLNSGIVKDPSAPEEEETQRIIDRLEAATRRK